MRRKNHVQKRFIREHLSLDTSHRIRKLNLFLLLNGRRRPCSAWNWNWPGVFRKHRFPPASAQSLMRGSAGHSGFKVLGDSDGQSAPHRGPLFSNHLESDTPVHISWRFCALVCDYGPIISRRPSLYLQNGINNTHLTRL